MADYRDFISFKVPEWLKDGLDVSDEAQEQGLAIQPRELSGKELRNIKRALEEIASTPEGASLLEKAAALSPDGKVNLYSLPQFYSVAVNGGGIAVGKKDSGVKYFSPETDQYHNMSVQRLLVHELYHKAHGHDHISPHNETEAVRETNTYMKKYYGEPARMEDTYSSDSVKFDGTKKWDFNKNFMQQGSLVIEETIQRVASLSSEQAGIYGEEIKLLHSLTDDHTSFTNALRSIAQNDLFTAVSAGLNETTDTAEETADIKVATAAPTLPPTIS